MTPSCCFVAIWPVTAPVFGRIAAAGGNDIDRLNIDLLAVACSQRLLSLFSILLLPTPPGDLCTTKTTREPWMHHSHGPVQIADSLAMYGSNGVPVLRCVRRSRVSRHTRPVRLVLPTRLGVGDSLISRRRHRTAGATERRQSTCAPSSTSYQ